MADTHVPSNSGVKASRLYHSSSPGKVVVSPVRYGRCRTAAEASYAPFRETFFHDARVNPRLRGEGWEPDAFAHARTSRRLWTAMGPSISTRSPKTAVVAGSAFQNGTLDRLYSSSKRSLGYEVHRSLRGSSLCSTTERFREECPTPSHVGPGSYDVRPRPSPGSHRHVHDPGPPDKPELTTRLKEWGSEVDAREMDAKDEWKTTSEKPSPTVFSFRRGSGATWIDELHERSQRRVGQYPLVKSRVKEPHLPAFVAGTKQHVHRKSPVMLKRLSPPSKETAQDEGKATTSLPAHVPEPLAAKNTLRGSDA